MSKVKEEMLLRYPIGTRLRLIQMDDYQAPISGTLGTINNIDDVGDLMVSWDDGSSLKLIVGIDAFEVIGN